MHLRRTLLLMALVLFVVAAVEALVPRDQGTGEAPGLTPAPVAGAPIRTIELRYPASRAVRRVHVASGAHVVIEVFSTRAGQAAVSALGLVQPAEPATPARFDVLAAQRGTYDVRFDPATGGTALIGTISVGGPS